jgi:hypothetical protein|tara:strand:+ start:287 stop:409 length:123 start_codon:yes stop_codon:yes gene_type:complete
MPIVKLKSGKKRKYPYTKKGEQQAASARRRRRKGSKTRRA